MYNLFSLICLYAFGHLASSTSVPFITKCNLNDSKCIKKSTQAVIPIFANGIPDMGIESLEPMELKKVDASTSNLKLIVTDLSIAGIKNCIAKKIQFDDSKPTKFLFKIECTADLKGNYEMNGQLLILPIQGKGRVTAVIRKIVFTITGEYGKITGKDGETHWDITNWKHTFDIKEKSDLNFENLFNGNEVLGKTAQEVINSSANDILLEIGMPFTTAFITNIISNVQKFFHTVPLKELIN
ncbi:circadian clock-controlled protein daywake-like [Galleria mellonella]|uniref:Circadian clock-controlled protein daywake-like n=1 Tax=Galleria mellonella TaxID=7137 RepID=A0A6J1WFX0_GALME|nr:circadian clock-controlled protein daywake-like [Galleria mellonella]